MQGDFRVIDQQHSTSLVWQIALGVFIGSLAAGAVMWGVMELRIRWEVDQAARGVAQAIQQVQRTADRSLKQSQQAEAARQEAAVAAERQQLAQEQAVRQAEQRKAAAWQRFYKPMPACVERTGTVDCANEFMRAKKAFDQKYQAGEL